MNRKKKYEKKKYKVGLEFVHYIFVRQKVEKVLVSLLSKRQVILCVCVCVYVCMYVCVCVYIYIYIYIYIYM
jgi:hypothetical protein